MYGIGNLVFHWETTDFNNVINKKEYRKRAILRWKEKKKNKKRQRYNPYFVLETKNNRSKRKICSNTSGRDLL